MRFFHQNKEISFDEFHNLMPNEAKILESSLDLTVDFEISESSLFVRSPYSNPISIDAAGKLEYHQKFFYKNSIYKQPLAKALGIKKGQDKPHIIDATAGFLSDSLLIMSFGCSVSAYERHPVAAALISNAIKINNLDIEFYFKDSSQMDFNAEIIYFDPMYSEKNEKTRPKKQMQIFRQLIGPDIDAEEKAKILKSKCHRLVIKRSIKSMPLLQNPQMTFDGKSTSYDVYF